MAHHPTARPASRRPWTRTVRTARKAHQPRVRRPEKPDVGRTPTEWRLTPNVNLF